MSPGPPVRRQRLLQSAINPCEVDAGEALGHKIVEGLQVRSEGSDQLVELLAVHLLDLDKALDLLHPCRVELRELSPKSLDFTRRKDWGIVMRHPGTDTPPRRAPPPRPGSCTPAPPATPAHHVKDRLLPPQQTIRHLLDPRLMLRRRMHASGPAPAGRVTAGRLTAFAMARQ
jgi:hypothetical protein